MKVLKPVLVLIIGSALGWALWHFSEGATGSKEPWDAGGLYFMGGLYVAGILATVVSPRNFFWAPVGVIIGQILFQFINIGLSPFFLLGCLFHILYGAIALAGAATYFGLYELIRGRMDITAVD